MTRQMQPVLWTKGLLLTPQHLQLQDRFLDDNLAFRLAAQAFCPWGFSKLEIDRDALAQGSLVVTSAAGIFPDGLLFDVPLSDPGPPPRPLEELWDQDRTSLALLMGIPERRPGGYNVSVDGVESRTRYLVDDVLRRDEITGTSERPIQVARKNIRLLAEFESLDGYSVLPVARIVRTPAGEFQLDNRFAPPALALDAADCLTTLGSGLVELLTARSSVLSGMRRERGRGQADFGEADVRHFWLLHSINTHLPGIRHILDVHRGHPAELWRALTSLAGALTTFSSEIGPTDLPRYDHGDLGRCFSELDKTLRRLLETVVPATHVSLPLERVRPTIHATAIDQDRYFEAQEMYLAIRADMKLEDLLRRVDQLLKVSSDDRMEYLVTRAVRGLQLLHAPDPPRGLPVQQDYQYFRLDRVGEDWDAVRAARHLAVYVPDEITNPQLKLLILLPPEE